MLIGDMHEQPMLHLKVKPFIVGAKDWSGEVSPISTKYRSLLGSVQHQLSASTTMSVHLSYYNLTNSHWEPCKLWDYVYSFTPINGIHSDRPMDFYNICGYFQTMYGVVSICIALGLQRKSNWWNTWHTDVKGTS